MEDKKKDIDDLLAAYWTDELTPEEHARLNEWIESSQENKAYFMRCQEIWFSSIEEENKKYDYEKAFNLFHKRVEAAEHRKEHRHIALWKSWSKYAAILLAVGLISYFSYQRGGNDLKHSLSEVYIEAPVGSQTRLRLPDGTSVVLNAGSCLSYSQDFGTDSREVTLEGEGYFEVTHNAEKPFQVLSEDLQIKVLGTKFNVRNYAEDEEAVVSLLEGKVALDNRNHQGDELILAPNERAILSKYTGSIRKEHRPTKADSQWINGDLIFDEMPLSEVAQILERNYNIQIRFTTDSIKNYRFYGRFNRSETGLVQILDILAATGKVRYTLKEKQVTLY